MLSMRTVALIASGSLASVCAVPSVTVDDVLSTSCAVARMPPRAAAHAPDVLRYAAHGGEVESLLLREEAGTNGQLLTGVTRLDDGTRLWEEARFDRSGALLRAEIMCACESGTSENIVLDVQAGVVEIRSSAGVQRWRVPTDYPWFWLPRDCAHASQTFVTTPVSVLVALHASQAGQGAMRRLAYLERFVSHTIMRDQVIVEEDAAASWVIVGDDAVLVRDGLPQGWRANALGLDIAQR